MPSDFPRSPKLLKGALIVFETKLPVPTNLIVFQYNPDTMTRGLQAASGTANPQAGSGDTPPVLPPLETFQVTVELDAADQLENPGANPLTVATGLHPSLAALELLMYPPSSALILNKVLSLAGSSLISPAQAPLVLFFWGLARILPVRVTSVSITELAFDPLLNPILAKVQLGMRSLTAIELQRAGPPFDTLAIVQQIAKEVLARSQVVSSAQRVGSMLPF